MGNKKTIICVIMFLVILIFGIIGPDLSNRDEYIQDKYVTTTETTEYASKLDATDTTEEVASETDSTEESFDEFYAQYDPNNKYIMSKDVEKKIEEIIDGMTLEEKVGQVFFIKNDGRFDGGILDKYPVGGVILFKGDFSGKTEEDVKANIADLQDNSKVPLLVGIDEEGGTVVRISEYSHLVPEKYKSPMDLYYEGGFDVIRQDTINKSELLLSYGINVNFAPVCDIPDDTGDFIFNRSMGGDLNLTVNYVGLSVETMSSVGMGSVLKHFPGYGNNGDTHSGIVKDSRPIEEFEATDFIPFKAGIEAGAWCVLVSHLVVESMDPAYPASLSPEVHRMLREDMGYEGVIITDDLMMKGVSEVFSEGDAAVQALLAGNDMVLSTDYQVQYAAVLRAVKSGEISEEQLENSIRRILRWKYTLGLLDI